MESGVCGSTARETMKIKILAVGKLKEKYWTDAVHEYMKRLGAYCDPEIIEVREARPTGTGAAADQRIKEEEGRDILALISKEAYVISLEIKGRKLSSEKLAEKISALALDGKSEIVFVIGGSIGLSPEVSRRADFALSFSDMTFPHQMMRVILLEQIYRSFKIIRGETYHK